MEFTPIKFSEQAVGRALARSKRNFTWEVGIEGVYHKIVLLCSYLTSRRQVNFDGVVMFNGIKEFRKDFIFSFGAARCDFRIEDRKEFIDLFIDDQSFSEALLSRPYEPNIPDFSQPSAPPKQLSEDDDWCPPLASNRRQAKTSLIVTRMMRDSFLDFDSDMPEPHRPKRAMTLQLTETSRKGVDLFGAEDEPDEPRQAADLI
jgi:hypothetical protein